MMTSCYGRNMAAVFMLAILMAGCASAPPPQPEPEPEPEVVQPVVAPEPEPMVEPEPEPIVEIMPEPEPAPVNERSYVVMQGDSLWAIASKQAIYMDAFQWPLIFKDNKSQIDDADLIYPGQVFIINLDPDSDEVAAAIEHARTRGPWSLGPIEDSDRRYLAR